MSERGRKTALETIPPELRIKFLSLFLKGYSPSEIYTQLNRFCKEKYDKKIDDFMGRATVYRTVQYLMTEKREEFEKELEEAKEVTPVKKDLLDYDVVREKLDHWANRLKDFKKELGRLNISISDFYKLDWESQKRIWNKVERIKALREFRERMIKRGFSYDPKDWTPSEIISVLHTYPDTMQYKILIHVRALRPDLDPKLPVGEYKKKMSTVREIWLRRSDYEKIMESKEFSEFEKMIISLHITLGCREGQEKEPPNPLGFEYSGLRGLRWDQIDWERKTINIWEGKVGGGILWLGCPLILFDDRAFNLLQKHYDLLDKPASGYIISVDGKKPVGYDFIRTLYSDKLSTFLGYPKGTLHAHDMRRTHATWLASMGVPLNIIAGKSLGGHRAKGYVGVGWETLDVLHKHYAMLSEDILENLYKQIHLAFMGKTEKIALEVKIDTEMLT